MVAKIEGTMVSSAQSMRNYHHNKLKICLLSSLRVLLTLLENLAILEYFASQSYMSTEIHDAIQAWLIKQLLEWSQDGQVTRKEADLNLQVGTSTLSHIYLNSLN